MPDYIGTSGSDRILGDRGGGLMQGLDGDDTLIVSSSGNFTLDGGAGNDGLYSGMGRDSLSGGPGNDYFDCGAADIISGGEGADVFNWGTSHTGGRNVALAPVILDWSPDDRIAFKGGQLASVTYLETTAADAAVAVDVANAAIERGLAKIVVVAVGADLYVFANLGINTFVYDDLVLIRGRGPGDISAANFISAGQSQVYLGTSSSDRIVGDRGAGTIQGLAGDDTLVAVSAGNFTIEGGAGGDRLYGGNDNDSLSGGDGDDLLEGGGGADTLAGGSGMDVFSWAPGAAGETGADQIIDWGAEDRLSFASGGVFGAGYLEASAADFTAARWLASAAIGEGRSNFVVVAVGGDLYVFADGLNNNGGADDVIRVRNRTLADIDASNFIVSAAGPPLPPPAAGPANPARGTVNGNMDLIRPADLNGSLIVEADSTGLQLQGQSASASVGGTGFTYTNNQLTAGTATTFAYSQAGVSLSVEGVNFPAANLNIWLVTNDAASALSTILAGANDLTGASPSSLAGLTGADLIRAFGGDDVIRGLGGPDSLFGGAGNDVIYANGSGNSPGPASTYLRGEDGNDYILGGVGFDDINGNVGADTAAGSAGDDWVVGGKDNDLLFGDSGADLVYGNLGDDTCEGGDGNDIVRGGQGNDLVYGDTGDDYVSGDRGDDTIAGGTGADVFHTFADAGIDRVVDFNQLQGDRVQLDPGTQYTVTQVGADVVISMTGGGQMILVNLAVSALQPGWIFGS